MIISNDDFEHDNDDGAVILCRSIQIIVKISSLISSLITIQISSLATHPSAKDSCVVRIRDYQHHQVSQVFRDRYLSLNH